MNILNPLTTEATATVLTGDLMINRSSPAWRHQNTDRVTGFYFGNETAFIKANVSDTPNAVSPSKFSNVGKGFNVK